MTRPRPLASLSNRHLFALTVMPCLFFLATLLTPIPAWSAQPSISTGAHHSLALKGDGTVWAWGRNQSGQLGDGTKNLNARAAQPVIGFYGPVSAVAAGFNHSLAVRNGRVWAWGGNEHGQLGDDSTTETQTPVPVQDLTDITAIAAGEGHSLALKSDGTVWPWACCSTWPGFTCS